MPPHSGLNPLSDRIDCVVPASQTPERQRKCLKQIRFDCFSATLRTYKT